MNLFQKKIPKKYLPEIQKRFETQRTFALIAKLIEGNTALIPDGQKEAQKYKVIADLITQDNNEHLAKVLMVCGFPLKDKIYDIRQDGTVIEMSPQATPEPAK
jgi:hypothetical protein